MIPLTPLGVGAVAVVAGQTRLHPEVERHLHQGRGLGERLGHVEVLTLTQDRQRRDQIPRGHPPRPLVIGFGVAAGDRHWPDGRRQASRVEEVDHLRRDSRAVDHQRHVDTDQRFPVPDGCNTFDDGRVGRAQWQALQVPHGVVGPRTIINPAFSLILRRFMVVTPLGLEPRTNGLKV